MVDGNGPATHTLTVHIAGAGGGGVWGDDGIACTSTGGTCSVQVAAGASVKLAAKPTDAASGFTAWSGDCSGTASACTVVMNSDRTVNAEFAPQFMLSVYFAAGSHCAGQPQGDARVDSNIAGLDAATCNSCIGKCFARVMSGTLVSITATAGLPAGASCPPQGGAPELDNPAITGACHVDTLGTFVPGPVTGSFKMDGDKTVTIETCEGPS
jgi:hypothetical protein